MSNLEKVDTWEVQEHGLTHLETAVRPVNHLQQCTFFSLYHKRGIHVNLFEPAPPYGRASIQHQLLIVFIWTGGGNTRAVKVFTVKSQTVGLARHTAFTSLSFCCVRTVTPVVIGCPYNVACPSIQARGFCQANIRQLTARAIIKDSVPIRAGYVALWKCVRV